MFSAFSRLRESSRPPWSQTVIAVLHYTGLLIEAEDAMKQAVLFALALAAIALFGSRPAEAYNGPWCAVFGIGPGSAVERCDYRDFESCRMEIIAGNRGFCRQNGYWQGGPAATSPRHRKARRHAQW
jgi:hypothetical protein